MPIATGLGRERPVGHRSELDGHFRKLPGKPFARTEIKRDILPAPVVNKELQGRECLRPGVRGHVFFPAVAQHFFAMKGPLAILPTDGALLDSATQYRSHCVKDIDLFVANLIRIE